MERIVLGWKVDRGPFVAVGAHTLPRETASVCRIVELVVEAAECGGERGWNLHILIRRIRPASEAHYEHVVDPHPETIVEIAR